MGLCSLGANQLWRGPFYPPSQDAGSKYLQSYAWESCLFFSRGHVPAALLNESVKDLLQMSEMFMGTSLLNSYLMAETIRTQGQSSSFYLVSQKSLVCMTSIPPQYHTTFTQQSEWHGKDIWISRISENEIIVWKWATPACEHILGRFWRFH